MNRLSFTVLLFTLGLSLSTFAAPVFVCVNPATGARIQFQQVSPGSSSGLYFEMNQSLVQNIREQGVSTIGRGVGSTRAERTFAFLEYNGELRLFKKDGGYMLVIEKQNQPYSNYVKFANFYFNPGECR